MLGAHAPGNPSIGRVISNVSNFPYVQPNSNNLGTHFNVAWGHKADPALPAVQRAYSPIPYLQYGPGGQDDFRPAAVEKTNS